MEKGKVKNYLIDVGSHVCIDLSDLWREPDNPKGKPFGAVVTHIDDDCIAYKRDDGIVEDHQLCNMYYIDHIIYDTPYMCRDWHPVNVFRTHYARTATHDKHYNRETHKMEVEYPTDEQAWYFPTAIGAYEGFKEGGKLRTRFPEALRYALSKCVDVRSMPREDFADMTAYQRWVKDGRPGYIKEELFADVFRWKTFLKWVKRNKQVLVYNKAQEYRGKKIWEEREHREYLRDMESDDFEHDEDDISDYDYVADEMV